MSGGSYDYLGFKDNDELMNHSVLEDMKRMGERLKELGFEDCSEETFKIKDIIEKFLDELQKRKNNIEKVWIAVEWFDSADSGRDYVEEKVFEYRLREKYK